MWRPAGLAAAVDVAADDLYCDRRLPESPPQFRNRTTCGRGAGWPRDLLPRDAELRHAPVRYARDDSHRRLGFESAAPELLDGDSSAVALHRLRQRERTVRLRRRSADNRQPRRHMDSQHAPMGDLLLVLPDARQSLRRALGVRSPRMGRLLGMGPGRKRRLHAVARDDRVPPFRDDPGTQGHAEGVEPCAHRDGLRAHALRHLPHAQRRPLVGAFVYAIWPRPVFPELSDYGCRPLHGPPAFPGEKFAYAG